jgi:Cu(I)/Ag(I) efflux system membrane fusion protein
MALDWPSPQSGIILEKKVVEGQMAKAGDELFRIADLSLMWVIADVSEQDVGLVEVGAPVTVTFRAYPDEPRQGRVTFILHELDARTRTAKVRIEVPNPDWRLRHEMYADVVIEAGGQAHDRLAVPVSSVIDSGTRQVVLVERGEGLFEPRAVKLGARGEGYVEVKDGITAGEKVVVSANFLIDAESNLKAALEGFTKDAKPEAKAGTSSSTQPFAAGDEKSAEAHR